MVINNNRYDLSDRLIHFFRRVDLAGDTAPAWPEDPGYASISESEVLQPAFLLRHAIRMGRLYATWSIRKGRRTIHGKRPAVCFTEMPIAAFIEAGRFREAKGQAMSPYGLVFPKAAAFRTGARPVIYGLTGDATAKGGEEGVPRLLKPGVLPLEEQYRYVAFDPSKSNLDWSHEREWRWRLPVKPWSDKNGIPPAGSEVIPGYDLDDPRLAGLGVIVASAAEADRVVFDILTKVDRGDISPEHYAFVIAHEEVDDWESLKARDALDDAINANLVELAPYFSMKGKRAQDLVAQLDVEIEGVLTLSGSPTRGEHGGCWLWILDNRHEMTRALVKKEMVEVNGEGKYLIPMDRFAEAGFSLREQEGLTEQLAGVLMEEFGLRADYFSVLSSTRPDAVPFYNGHQLDDHRFYNWNWERSEIEEAVSVEAESDD